MIEPELFDVIELLRDLPDYQLKAGQQGAIVECYENGKFEVEFSDSDGETLALCPLSSEQFIVVWKAKTKQWLSLAEKVASVVFHLSDEHRREVLDFARFLYQR
ncbi:DUF4926 domain-containing protein [Gloeothece verrucosa]|uniref:DUF4926 domain-containing protein n=1 Tax=Gloeothece verrucosa (strain PCC 7822) TaxID=497965 RepID=E0UFJ5_GLOV7|nr:DUF4926 domain-containing protein [Gloeothece verrucosa]ADN16689.1 conserved hypothetical protein [Gloeothece verrucosa PCC 7822]